MNAKERLAQMRQERTLSEVEPSLEASSATSAADRLAELREERQSAKGRLAQLRRERERAALEAELADAEEARTKADLRLQGEELSIVDKALSGATNFMEAFTGYGDELEAGVRALSGDEDFGTAIENVRKRQDQWKAANPVSSTIGTASGIVGSALGGGALANKAIQGTNKVAKAGAFGAGEGAVYGFGQAEGDFAERAKGAAVGATVGGVAGAGAQKLADVVQARATRKADKAEDDATEVVAEADAPKQQEFKFETPDGNTLDAEATEGAIESIVASRIYKAKKRTGGEMDSLDPETSIVDELAESYGIVGDDVTAAVATQVRKLSNASDAELAELSGDVVRRDGLADTAGTPETPLKEAKRGMDNLILPLINRFRTDVGEGFANTMEKALVSTLPRKQNLDNTVEKLTPIITATENNKAVKAALMNASNTNITDGARAAFRQRAIKLLKEDPALKGVDVEKLMDEYDEVRSTITRGYGDTVGVQLTGQGRLHTQKAPRGSSGPRRQTKSNVGADEALQAQTRPVFTELNIDDVDDYMNPWVSDNRWLRERIQDTEVIKAFNLPRATQEQIEEVTEGTYVLGRLEDEVRTLGGNNDTVNVAGELSEVALYDSLQATNPFMQTLRNLNVAFGLASPKSATLNITEPFIMMLDGFTARDIVAAMARQQNLALSPRELGLIATQAGDELRKIQALGGSKRLGEGMASSTQKMTEKVMKWSGFEASALYGQGNQMRAALRKAGKIVKPNDAGKVTSDQMKKFDAEYGKWFDKAEQTLVVNGINKLNKIKKGQAVEDVLTEAEQAAVVTFQLTELSRWQPLTAMGRSYRINKNPWVRPFLLFTTYTTRLHDSLSRGAAKSLKESRRLRKEGKTTKANAKLAEATGRYLGATTFAASLFAVTNQARQQLWGAIPQEAMREVGLIDEDGTPSEWDKADWEGLYEDLMFGSLSQATGGILPANKIGYKDPEDFVKEVMSPTMIPADMVAEAWKRESLTPILQRTPVIGNWLVKPLAKEYDDEIKEAVGLGSDENESAL